MATDSSWVLSLILAASTLVAVAGHTLPSAWSAAVALMGVAAAIGVFASLAVQELVHGLTARACGERVFTRQRGVTTARWHQGALES